MVSIIEITFICLYERFSFVLLIYILNVLVHAMIVKNEEIRIYPIKYLWIKKILI
jgi:hypothetical protein